MPKFPRRVGFRSVGMSIGIQLSPSDAQQDDNATDEFGEAAELPAPKPDDPARVTVAVMLGHALAASGTAFEEAGCDGAVTVVVVPDVEWTHPARDEWRTAARRGESYNEAGADRYWESSTWAAWAPTEAPRASWAAEAAEGVAREIGHGRHCAGFAADETWLPTYLVQSRDHRLVLAALTGLELRAVALRLCGGEPAAAPPDDLAARATPRLLRLARRLGQTADAYLAKLGGLLAAAAASAPTAAEPGGSPRDAPTLARLNGMEEVVAWGTDLACDPAAYREGRLAWADVDRGCLLSGPPGCGKTMSAEALASTCGVPLVTGSYGEWHASGSGHQGCFLKAMRKTFANARDAAPAILFIDEVDSFPDRASLTHDHADYMVQVVNALLAEIDGTEGREGVVLVGACNHPERLDPALVRSGRLDRHVHIGLLGRTALAAILREHLGDDLAGANLSGAAMAAAGSSGADCEKLVRGARRRARSAGRPMALADLLDEIGGDRDGSDADRRTAAVHEAGHAVAACVLRPGSVGMVSLRGAADAGGMTQAALLTSAFLRPEDLRVRLSVLLAGRAAEEAVFSVASSGAGGTQGSDLGRATMALLDAFAAFGLDDTGGGLVWRGVTDLGRIQEALAADPALADRVRVRLDDAYGEALALIRPRLAALEALTQALLERSVLDGPQVEEIVMAHEPGFGARP